MLSLSRTSKLNASDVTIDYVDIPKDLNTKSLKNIVSLHNLGTVTYTLMEEEVFVLCTTNANPKVNIYFQNNL